MENLEIEQCMSSDNVEHSKDMDDNISNIINKYKTHLSILEITENVKLETKFKYLLKSKKLIQIKQAWKEISRLKF